MINLLRKLRRILHPNKWKNIGKEETILSQFQDWIYRKLTRCIGALERAKEIILFIPVIYTNVTWDYSSIYHILQHWLKRMENIHREDKMHLHANKRADEIKLCITLLERLKHDDYDEMALAEHDKYWGEIHTWSSPAENHPVYGKVYQWNSARPNVKSPEDMARERKEFRNCLKHSEYMRQQDLELLFSTIKKHHRGWWV